MDDSDRRKASIKSVLTYGICKKRCRNVTIIEKCCHRSLSTSPSPTPSSSNAKGKGKKGRHGKKKNETNNIIPLPPPPSTPPTTDHHEAATTSSGTKVHPIWFTLVACDNRFRKCPSPLPQISSHYIKIKDVNMPASYIKRYLAKKLTLQSEDEVEICMLGMSIRSALPLHHLVDLWLRATPIIDKKVKVENSAKDFVMVLKYARTKSLRPNYY